VIALLRAADMPLREIRRFLVDPRPELLGEYEARIQADHARRLDVMRYVRRVLEEADVFEVKTKRVPAQRYASRTENVAVADLDSFISASIAWRCASVVTGSRRRAMRAHAAHQVLAPSARTTTLLHARSHRCR